MKHGIPARREDIDRMGGHSSRRRVEGPDPTGLRVGSAAVQVPEHSIGPVIVVRPTLPHVRRDGVRVVVGVDGSPASRAALDFAFAAAENEATPCG